MTKLGINQISLYDDLAAQTTIASQYLVVKNDFLFGLGEFSSAVSGTGAAVGITAFSNTNHAGLMTLSTGTTATGSSRIGYGSTGSSALIFGFGEWKFEACVQVSLLSTGTETFSVQTGFPDNPTPTDGVYFRYTHSENSGKWQACTRTNNNAINSIDTGITVNAVQWYTQTIIVNAAGTLATFFIDGVQVASTSASIPTGAGRQTGVACNILKSVGVTSRNFIIDFMDVVCKFTTPR
jgi:hypothetical protein